MKNSSPDFASTVISDCLKVKADEEVVIFIDKNNLCMAEELARSIKEFGAKSSIFYIPDSIRPVEKITDIHAVSLISADVVIYILDIEIADLDLSREVAFRHYLATMPIQYKGRVCMMPGFSDEMMSAVLVNYPSIQEKCYYLKNILLDKEIHIETDLGTDIRFNTFGRKIEVDNGDISKPGMLGNIPAGEIYTAPVEESINGRIVIDGSVGDLGPVKHPFSIELKSGQIEQMQSMGSNDDVFERFAEICELDAPATKTVGEFGIGLNPRARIIGNMLLDEKVEGTIHFAFGDSYSLGKSNSKFHTDLLIKNPSIFVNRKCIMEKGKFIFDNPNQRNELL